MSEDNVITRKEKTKDPRRVVMGKRLASISKEAKERKARERFALESISEETEDQTEGKCEASSINLQTVLTIGFISAVVIGGFSFSKMNSNTPPEYSSYRQVDSSYRLVDSSCRKVDSTGDTQEAPTENTKTVNFISFDE